MTSDPHSRLADLFVRSVAIFISLLSLAPSPMRADDRLVFNQVPPTNDLKGSFEAQVLFAQSQIIPANPRPEDHQPHLVGMRKTLFIVRPVQSTHDAPISVTVRNRQGETLGTLDLQPPDQLPKTAYYVDGAPTGPIDFTPLDATVSTIQQQSDLSKLDDPNGAFLLTLLQRHAVVDIDTANGRWVRNIHLPHDPSLEGKIVRARSQAGYESTFLYSGRQANLSNGRNLQFKYVQGQWLQASDLENNSIVYATDAWSVVLPAEWIVPGVTFEIRQGGRAGELKRIQVGAPTQLLIHTIDVGMLTSPRGEFAFAKDPEAHREYFQTVPVSRLIVSQYAPLTLREVMLPNGKLLTDADPSEGGWHTGTMRQSIGKELISHGIDNANYGIHSSSGEGEDSHPYVAAQLAVHNNRGNYSNGVQVHGGSGGAGIVTLDQSLGNEFSHEVGHNYGLGHFVGGFQGSVHRSSDQDNSTWGWDADKNRFLPNFAPTRSRRDTCLEGQCQAPFDGRSFGVDAMAGGNPLSGMNRFTLYTPNSASIIQGFLESKAIFDSRSPTGFSRWNAGKSLMEPYNHQIQVGSDLEATISELDEAKLAAWIAKYDRVNIAMADGNWKPEIPLPPASAANRGRVVTIDHKASYSSTLLANGNKLKITKGFKKSFQSDGRIWNARAAAAVDRSVDRKPKQFGVPVVTLVGYYDPDEQMQTYIYPPMHGACGFCYPDDGTMKRDDCHVLVETRDGVLRFRLADHRLNKGTMNKFHINVPEASQPRRVAVVIDGAELDQRTIEPCLEKLVMTVNGVPTARKEPAATKEGSEPIEPR
jgi:hypothetical protein